MPATSLRCRSCAAEYALEDIGTCTSCFGPLDPVYDWDELRRTVTGETVASGPASLWRYAPLLPVDAPAEPRLAPGFTPLVRAPRLADEVGVGELLLKLDTANPTHSFKDRVVAVAAAKARELGIETLACSSTGNLANAVAARAAAEGLEPPSSARPTSSPRSSSRPPSTVRPSTRSAEPMTMQPAHRRALLRASLGFVNVSLRSYYAEGSKTVAFEIAEQLGWDAPDAVVAPIASGSLYSKLAEGFDQLRRVGLLEAETPRVFGGQAEGCSPVAAAFAAGEPVAPVRPATVARSLAIGNPADGDKAVATARRTGGAIYAVAESEVGANMGLLAEHAGVFGETAAGVSLGALRRAVDEGELGADDRVVLVVTGDGLKTPAPVRGTPRSRQDRGGRGRGVGTARRADVTVAVLPGTGSAPR
jgi:threonine synthase